MTTKQVKHKKNKNLRCQQMGLAGMFMTDDAFINAIQMRVVGVNVARGFNDKEESWRSTRFCPFTRKDDVT